MIRLSRARVGRSRDDAGADGDHPRQAFTRYQELRSGWSWDLAYYNQWFWASRTATDAHGPPGLGLRARRAVGLEDELPRPDPVRAGADLLRCSPIRGRCSSSRTSCSGGSFRPRLRWCALEYGSDGVALSAAALVPLTPLVLAAGVERFPRAAARRSRSSSGPSRGCGPRPRDWPRWGSPACSRAGRSTPFVVASMSLLPARNPEDTATRRRWAAAALVVRIRLVSVRVSRLPVVAARVSTRRRRI